MRFNFKLKKRYIILIAVLGFIVFILVGAKHKADIRHAQEQEQLVDNTEIDAPEIKYENEDIPSGIDIDELPTENNGVKVENHQYESIDDMLKNNKPVENEFKSLSIGSGEGKVTPAVVAGDINKYRKYSLVQVADVQVLEFIPKELYGQTLVRVEVPVDGINGQSLFFGCTDSLELTNQLDLYKRINIVGNASDMIVTDIRLEDGTVYHDALIVLGVFSRIF